MTSMAVASVYCVQRTPEHEHIHVHADPFRLSFQSQSEKCVRTNYKLTLRFSTTINFEGIFSTFCKNALEKIYTTCTSKKQNKNI